MASKGSIAAKTRDWTFFIVIGSLFLGTFLVALDTTIIGTATPAISSAFHDLGDIGWYGSGYFLTLTALQPSFGKIFIILDVKSVYVFCILVFEAGSIVCATASSSVIFIIGRSIQGCGAAGILQGALLIVTKAVSLEKRPLYLGIVISAFALCVKIGPLLGGVFTEHVTWRWCFWINVPTGAIVMILIMVFLKLERSSEKVSSSSTWYQKVKELDLVGTVLIIASICCLLLALQRGGQTVPWNSPSTVGLFVGSGLMFILFMLIQWKGGDHATLPFSILLRRSIISGALYLFAMAMPTYVYFYYIPIYFQSIKGFSPLRSGIDFLALAIPQIGFTVLSGWLASRFGYYTPYLICGTAISVIGSGLFTMLNVDTRLGTWVAYFLVIAFGTGISANHPYTAVQAVLDETSVPIGNAIMQFAFFLGGALGLCIAETIFINTLRSEVTRNIPDVPVDQVISAGAYGLATLASYSPETLLLLKEAYTYAIQRVFLFALVAGALAFLFSLGFEHRNLRQVAKEREQINLSASQDDLTNQ
ncbi:MFS general substrate transporter [Mollisia scopiformis]|uniref:MFS general substrate transporter n=1 Tax=Mollisia scopiformis TaxID=149040 RepID=A0A194XW46_MOLSC|nr:MFS general substrate transporter [Mollisia scopiformis]KUJ24525.1 MFS general substrate transporter [Mollisia scopiformis]